MTGSLSPVADDGAANGPANGAAGELGAAMRYHRIAKGLSLRGMARRLRFSGHSNLADYERARRLPGPEIVAGYERTLQLPPGELADIHRRALAERAGRVAARSAGHDGAVIHAATARAADGAVRVEVSIRLPHLPEPVELAISVASDEDTRPP